VQAVQATYTGAQDLLRNERALSMRKRIILIALLSLGLLASVPGGAQQEPADGEELLEEEPRDLYHGPPAGAAKTAPCPYHKPHKCYDGQCVFDQADCPSPPTCISGKRYRCPNGACVTDYALCGGAPQGY
jgi:hypothetical protein